MIIPGKEFISKLFRTQTKEKSPGQSKKSLTIKEKREFIQTCSKLADLAEQIHDLESMSILETSLSFMVGHLDRKTRDSLFTIVNLTADAKQAACQRCLVTPAMIKHLNANKDNIQAGIVAKSIVDLLVDSTSGRQANIAAKDQIFKSVVLRLALELSHNALTDVAQQITPMKDKKLKNNIGSMYG